MNKAFYPNEIVPNLNTLYFYLTEGCNLACRHCWLAPKLDPNADKEPVLALDTFDAIIKEAKPLGLQSVKLTGGEPLMHPDIVGILKIVRREGLGLRIESNAMRCTPDLAEEIAKSPNRFVSVSVDGADAETHEYVRNIPGSYLRTLFGIRNLVAAGTPPQIIMSLMRCNADQVDDLVYWAERVGAHSVKFNIVQPTERGKRLAEGSDGLSVEEYIRIGRHVEDELAKKVSIPLYYDYPAAFRSMRIMTGQGITTCGIKGILGVLATGEYALCGVGQHTPGMVFGEAGRDPLAEVWGNHQVLKTVRTGLPRKIKGVCARCIMKHVCLGACVAQNYYRTHDILAPFWFCEEAEKIGLFPKSRLTTDSSNETPAAKAHVS